MKLGPVTFLFAVVIGWAAIRTLVLWPGAPGIFPAPTIAWQAPLSRRPGPPAPIVLPAARGAVARTPAPGMMRQSDNRVAQPLMPEPVARPLPTALGKATIPAVAPIHPPATGAAYKDHRKEWRTSAWAIVRETGRKQSLAAAGQLGGAQAGVRATYELGPGWALAARLSGPLAARQGKEAAVAVDWRPMDLLPVTFTIERRDGLDRGGRDAFAAGVFGGFVTRMPLGILVDGYAQAGVVGLKRRDAYADGALRVEHLVARKGKARISAGAGIWGGVQPGVSRVDAGPQLVAHVPVGPASLRLGAEWRERVAGNARPGSGPALSIGADF